MRTLIIGCGYVGLPLGQVLAEQGHQVLGVRRSLRGRAILEAAGIEPLAADLTRPEDLARLPAPFDWVVNCAAAAPGGPAAYQAVYYEGTRNLLEWLRAVPPKKYVYTSSTGVYGQDDGSLVTETCPTEPATETGRILVQTEQLLLAAARRSGFPALLLRVAGIYGPERGHYFNLFLRNEARIEGTGDRYLNMIHRDDVVGCLQAALDRGRTGELYHAVDDEPVTQIAFFQWLADQLGKPLPPRVPAAEVQRQRAVTNKRISNHKLKAELSYQFRYPTFREGYASLIVEAKTRNAGRL